MSDDLKYLPVEEAGSLPQECYYSGKEAKLPDFDEAFEEWMRNEVAQAGIAPDASQNERIEAGQVASNEARLLYGQDEGPKCFNASNTIYNQHLGMHNQTRYSSSPSNPDLQMPRGSPEQLQSPPLEPRDIGIQNQATREAFGGQASDYQRVPQSTFRQPRFTDIIDAQMNHLMLPGWRPGTGAWNIPLDNAGLMPYVAQLYNGFINTDEVYDEHKKPGTADHFRAGGIWLENLDDIEAICHLIVHTAYTIHTTGATSLQFKRFPQRVPQPGSEDWKLTFAQRIWLMARLARHYKVHADALMRQFQIEDHLVWMWKVLMETTDFRARLNTRPPLVKAAIVKEFQDLGIPQSQVQSHESQDIQSRIAQSSDPMVVLHEIMRSRSQP